MKKIYKHFPAKIYKFFFLQKCAIFLFKKFTLIIISSCKQPNTCSLRQLWAAGMCGFRNGCVWANECSALLRGKRSISGMNDCTFGI